jgi:hypothetical protein|nr:MAG TPA: replisome organizer [Caudoviricetes sp.]
MPNRILKESICRSEEIDSLSWFEEVLFYRLIVTCDDYGRYDGRAKVIKGTCFPLKDITEKDIDKALSKLSAVGLVKIYEIQEKPYLQLITWGEHQRIRNQKSKYPEYDPKCDILLTIDSKRQQEQANDSNCEQNQSEQVEPPVITLLLNTGEEYGISQSNVYEWSELYPAVDIMQCLRNMKGWLLANKSKRKTIRGINKFIIKWLQNEQDKGGTRGYKPVINQATTSKVEQFAAGAMEWASNG